MSADDGREPTAWAAGETASAPTGVATPGDGPVGAGIRSQLQKAAIKERMFGAHEELPTLGRYALVRLLGEGGMGAVYEARHLRLDKRVAIKTMHPHVAQDERLRKRFLREARAASRIRSDHVVEILDFGDEPVPHFAMEFMEGQDLAALLHERGRLEWTEALPLLRPVLLALKAAHDIGVVHRDLKPLNIFLQRRVDGSEIVKVVDFGLAKVAESSPETMGLTGTDEVMGTATYMAPEQAAAGTIDGRTDIYAAGVVLFHMLTGAVPFASKNVYEVLNMQIGQPPPRPRSLQSTIPEALEAIVLCALAKDPDQRFADMGAFVAALDVVRSEVPAAGDPLAGTTAPGVEATLHLSGADARAGTPAVEPTLFLDGGAQAGSRPAEPTAILQRQEMLPKAAGAPNRTDAAVSAGPREDASWSGGKNASMATVQPSLLISTLRPGWHRAALAAAVVCLTVVAGGVAYLLLADSADDDGVPETAAVARGVESPKPAEPQVEVTAPSLIPAASPEEEEERNAEGGEDAEEREAKVPSPSPLTKPVSEPEAPSKTKTKPKAKAKAKAKAAPSDAAVIGTLRRKIAQTCRKHSPGTTLEIKAPVLSSGRVPSPKVQRGGAAAQTCAAALVRGASFPPGQFRTKSFSVQL